MLCPKYRITNSTSHTGPFSAIAELIASDTVTKKWWTAKFQLENFGNGFKSGSMRLGDDAIVLSRSEKDRCVGMLSQSYLRATGAKQDICGEYGVGFHHRPL
ncbi:hypothetical protein NHX12_024990 [Muraenolepis orangiensis]|uniref:Uncharacterized protein n=1 Tax=Muraenolepis orangiensis TaxID=630683 RepID=A0A9Q0EIH5_9TELE|nr:hypothetical protein NHX12_024990 [Muraenolepis orangiensis]